MKLSRLIPIAVVVVALAACSSPIPPGDAARARTSMPSPAATPSAVATTPLVTQNEVDAKSKPAYLGYVKMRSRILNDGGTGVNRIAEWVTPAFLATERPIYKTYRQYKTHLTGSVRTSQFRIESYHQSAGERPLITITACEDYTHLRQVNPDGERTRAFRGFDNMRVMIVLTTSNTDPSRFVVAHFPYQKPDDCD